MGKLAKSKARRRPARAIPAEVERLRHAPDVIDPTIVYRLALPDGSTYRATGAELLETAAAAVDLADADRVGDRRAIEAALHRLELA